MELKTMEVKVLKEIKEPITIKGLQERSGIKWAYLSKILRGLEQDGYIVYLGKDKKSKVIQSNKHRINQYFAEKEAEERMMKYQLLTNL